MLMYVNDVDSAIEIVSVSVSVSARAVAVAIDVVIEIVSVIVSARALAIPVAVLESVFLKIPTPRRPRGQHGDAPRDQVASWSPGAATGSGS